MLALEDFRSLVNKKSVLEQFAKFKEFSVKSSTQNNHSIKQITSRNLLNVKTLLIVVFLPILIAGKTWAISEEIQNTMPKLRLGSESGNYEASPENVLGMMGVEDTSKTFSGSQATMEYIARLFKNYDELARYLLWHGSYEEFISMLEELENHSRMVLLRDDHVENIILESLDRRNYHSILYQKTFFNETPFQFYITRYKDERKKHYAFDFKNSNVSQPLFKTALLKAADDFMDKQSSLWWTEQSNKLKKQQINRLYNSATRFTEPDGSDLNSKTLNPLERIFELARAVRIASAEERLVTRAQATNSVSIGTLRPVVDFGLSSRFPFPQPRLLLLALFGSNSILNYGLNFGEETTKQLSIKLNEYSKNAAEILFKGETETFAAQFASLASEATRDAGKTLSVDPAVVNLPEDLDRNSDFEGTPAMIAEFILEMKEAHCPECNGKGGYGHWKLFVDNLNIHTVTNQLNDDIGEPSHSSVRVTVNQDDLNSWVSGKIVDIKQNFDYQNLKKQQKSEVDMILKKATIQNPSDKMGVLERDQWALERIVLVLKAIKTTEDFQKK